MFSLKCLTKKFNKQTLNEVKPAPLSETVDHTLSAALPSTGHASSCATTLASSPMAPPNTFSSTPPTNSNHDPPTFFNSASLPSPTPSTSSTSSSVIAEDSASQSHTIAKLPSANLIPSHSYSSSTTSFPSPQATVSTSSLSPVSSISSDSEESEDEDAHSKWSPSLRVRAAGCPRSPRKVRLAGTQLRIERISSAEKRKYSQFKCSTGSNSSPSSSDDEIKEAFEAPSTSSSRQRWNITPPTNSGTLWAQTMPSLSSTTSENLQQPQQQQQQVFNNSWSTGHFEACTSRPLKVTQVGHNKHKFFAQMSSRFSSERPYLDFNKMQHSKRVVTVRRPMVIRNHSKVHSIQRPPSFCPHVSLDISQSSFQPVLTQT